MPNKLYIIPETAIVWTDTTGDLAMTLNNLAATTGMRQGAVKDFGATARAGWFLWRFIFQSATTPVLGEYAQIYLKTSNGTYPDNDDGTGDIAVSAADKLKNLDPLGICRVDQAATAIDFVKSGSIYLPHRYFMPVVANLSADNFVATNNVSKFILQPLADEWQ